MRVHEPSVPKRARPDVSGDKSAPTDLFRLFRANRAPIRQPRCQPPRATSFARLPSVLASHIFTFLTLFEHARAAQTSAAWRRTASDAHSSPHAIRLTKAGPVPRALWVRRPKVLELLDQPLQAEEALQLATMRSLTSLSVSLRERDKRRLFSDTEVCAARRPTQPMLPEAASLEPNPRLVRASDRITRCREGGRSESGRKTPARLASQVGVAHARSLSEEPSERRPILGSHPFSTLTALDLCVSVSHVRIRDVHIVRYESLFLHLRTLRLNAFPAGQGRHLPLALTSLSIETDLVSTLDTEDWAEMCARPLASLSVNAWVGRAEMGAISRLHKTLTSLAVHSLLAGAAFEDIEADAAPLDPDPPDMPRVEIDDDEVIILPRVFEPYTTTASTPVVQSMAASVPRRGTARRARPHGLAHLEANKRVDTDATSVSTSAAERKVTLAMPTSNLARIAMPAGAVGKSAAGAAPRWSRVALLQSLVLLSKLETLQLVQFRTPTTEDARMLGLLLECVASEATFPSIAHFGMSLQVAETPADASLLLNVRRMLAHPNRPLQTLQLSSRVFGRESAAQLCAMTASALRTLNVRECRWVSTSLARLATFPSLTELNLDGFAHPSHAADGATLLPVLPRLRALSMIGGVLAISALARLYPRLTHLAVPECGIADLAHLRLLPHLRSLDLRSCRLLVPDFGFMSTQPPLRQLRVALNDAGEARRESRLPAALACEQDAIGKAAASEIARHLNQLPHLQRMQTGGSRKDAQSIFGSGDTDSLVRKNFGLCVRLRRLLPHVAVDG